MSNIVNAVYEDGVFRPLHEIQLPEHKRVKLEIILEENNLLIESQKTALTTLKGVGSSNLTNVARMHDKYLYQKDW